jgi:hypothetical protein
VSTGIAFAVALVCVAFLAHDAWRRYLAHGTRIDSARLEAVDDLARAVAELKREVANLKLQIGMRGK